MARVATGSNATVTGEVVIKGDTRTLVSEATKAKTSIEVLGKETSKQAAAIDSAMVNSGKSAGRFTEAAKKIAPSLGAASAAALTTKASLGSLVSVVLASANAFGPLGIVVAAAGTALYTYVNAQNAAAEATRLATEEMKKQKREADKLAHDERAAKAVARIDAEVSADQKRRLEEELGRHQDIIREKEREIAISKDSTEIRLHEITIMKQEAEIALSNGDLQEYQNKLHQADLATLRLTVGEEEKRTGELKKQNEILEERRRFDPRLAASIDSQIVAGGLSADESSASRFGGTVIDPFSHENEMQIAMDMLEEKKKAQHEAEKQRLEEIKQAEDDRIDQIEFKAGLSEDAAKMAVAGILDISDARRDAIRVAKLQGATEREAQQAGRIATMIALESQLKSLRNMAAMHAIEYTAKGIASQASTYGIPNPQSVGYFTAAGIFAGIAVGTGLGAMAAGNRADSLQGGASGGGFGGFGGGGAANGGRGGGAANTGPSPIDSSVPGSPTPQPRSGTLPMGNTVIYQIDKVYGTVDKDFIRKVDFGLGELGHERRVNR